jgi:hypothetical protein
MVPEQARRARLRGGNPLGGSARGPSFFPSTLWPEIAEVYQALKEVDYQGALTMEPLPPIPDAFMAISMEEFLPLRDVYAEECIMRLRQYEREV